MPQQRMIGRARKFVDTREFARQKFAPNAVEMQHRGMCSRIKSITPRKDWARTTRSTIPGVTYLVGCDGQYLGFVLPQANPERLVEVIRAQLVNQR
jgi:hypothetical protein